MEKKIKRVGILTGGIRPVVLVCVLILSFSLAGCGEENEAEATDLTVPV